MYQCSIGNIFPSILKNIQYIEGVDSIIEYRVLFSSEKEQLGMIQQIGRSLRTNTNPDDLENVADIVDCIRESDNRREPNADDDRPRSIGTFLRSSRKKIEDELKEK